jgi:hypothetical protein
MIDLHAYRQLAEIEYSDAVSLYIPTHRAGHVPEDRIRFKNQLQKVEAELEKRGLNPREIRKRTQAAWDKYEEEDFWLQLSDGLAVFLEDKTRFHRVPVSFPEFLYLGEQLYLKPLLPLIARNQTFFLLAFSQQKIRFYEGALYEIAEIELTDAFPENIEHFLKYEVGQDDLQKVGGSENQAIYHGQGNDRRKEDVRLEAYVRQINKGVESLMCHDDDAPLFLAGDQDMVSRFRDVNTYSHLQKEFLPGNPDEVDPVVLHHEILEILADKWQNKVSRAQKEWQAAMASGKGSDKLETIAQKAIAGRVEVLFVESGHEVWGKYDPRTHQVSLHEDRKADSLPLLEEATRSTLLQGGSVYTVSMAESDQAGTGTHAIFRY